MSPVTLSCDTCGARLERRRSQVHDHNFCANDCRMQFWREEVQPKMAAEGRRVLATLREIGHDPAHGGDAARKRGAKIAESNRRKPRRRKDGQER